MGATERTANRTNAAFGAYAAAALVLLTMGRPASARDKAPSASLRKTAFDLLDADGDESLSVEEFVGGSLGRAARNKEAEFRSWDLDSDGVLSPEEFRKRGNHAPPPRNYERDFQRRDRNFDGVLTLDELIGSRTGTKKRDAKGWFFRRDVDDDGLLTPEEYAGPGVPPSTDERFQFQDVDEDGELSEEEFVGPAEGKRRFEDRRRNFRRFDLDGSGSLALREFRLTPAQKPDAETMFYGRDADLDGRLTPEELTRWMNGWKTRRAVATFGEYDADGDGLLSLPEYEAREAALAAGRSRQYWTALLETWGTRTLVLLDVLLVAWLVRAFRRWRNRPARPEPAAIDPAGGSEGGDPKDGPLRTPSSIDEFEVC